MKKHISLLFALVMTFNATANEPASREALEELIELMEIPKMMDSVYDQVTSSFDGLAQQMEISPQEQPLFEQHMQKVMTLFKQEMGWEKLKEPMLKIYADRFSEAEVREMTKFYQTDIGRSVIKKMPLVIQDSTAMSQKMMVDVMPKMQALTQEFIQSVEEARKQGASQD